MLRKRTTFVTACGGLAMGFTDVPAALTPERSSEARASAANYMLSKSGRVGDLRVGAARQSDVRRDYGQPSSTRPHASANGRATGTVFVYRCGPRCSTQYLFDRSGILQEFVTTNRRKWRTAAGSRVGTTLAQAERREGAKARSGCVWAIRRRSGRTALVLTVSGGRVEELSVVRRQLRGC